MTRKLITALAILALAALGLAACGGDDDDSGDETAATTEETTTTEAEAPGGGGGAGGGKGGTIDIQADPNGALAYETGDLTVDSGPVEINFENPAALGHDVRIEGPDGSDLGGTSVFSEGSETATVDLEPGEYTYFCSVGGHRAAGMEQTLTVE